MRYPDPAQCVRLLDCLLRSFGKNGQQWTRFTYADGNGNHCLIGAVDYIERKHRSLGSGMTDYLSAAIWPRRPREWCLERVASFNDHCKGFEANPRRHPEGACIGAARCGTVARDHRGCQCRL